MPTTMEGLTQLGQDLRDAVASVLGLRGDMQTLKDSTTNSATTIIQQFINRPASTSFACDFNNGTDSAEDGFGTLAKPFKTVDYAIDRGDPMRPLSILMLTDDTIKRSHTLYANVIFTGVSRTPGNFGLSYSTANRRLAFASEASDSPVAGTGRIPGRLNLIGSGISLFCVDLALPDLSAAIDSPYLISMAGGSVTINTSTITAASAGTLARLIDANGLQRITVNIVNTTFGSNVPGKLLNGIAAGVNPNTSFAYESNITSA